MTSSAQKTSSGLIPSSLPPHVAPFKFTCILTTTHSKTNLLKRSSVKVIRYLFLKKKEKVFFLSFTLRLMPYACVGHNDVRKAEHISLWAIFVTSHWVVIYHPLSFRKSCSLSGEHKSTTESRLLCRCVIKKIWISCSRCLAGKVEEVHLAKCI